MNCQGNLACLGGVFLLSASCCIVAVALELSNAADELRSIFLVNPAARKHNTSTQGFSADLQIVTSEKLDKNKGSDL